MSRDRSLEEFLDGAASDGSDSGDGSENGPKRAADAGAPSGDDPAEIDPIVPTYRWSEDGAACGVCGERVRARWHSEDGFVCSDCKEW